MSKSGLKNIRITPAGNYEVIISSRSYGTFHDIDKAISVRDKAEHDRIAMKADLKFRREYTPARVIDGWANKLC